MSVSRAAGAGWPAERIDPAAHEAGGQRLALVGEALHELVPGFDERLRPFELQLLAPARRRRCPPRRNAPAPSPHRRRPARIGGADLALAWRTPAASSPAWCRWCSGAASASTYSVCGAFGSFMPVLAHSMRCLHRARGREIAPALAREQVAMRAVGAPGDRRFPAGCAAPRAPCRRPPGPSG